MVCELNVNFECLIYKYLVNVSLGQIRTHTLINQIERFQNVEIDVSIEVKL